MVRAIRGEPIPDDDPKVRRFLGWAVGSHWLLK
jgi:hypothetical protein